MLKYLIMELLSPASDMAALKAAVQNGADAVYLGGTHSARRFAKPIQSIEEAVGYARLYGVRVYYALNTLIYDYEFDSFLAEAKTAARAGVSAFIVQDLGAMALLKETFPDIAIHVSTQAAAHNTDNMKLFEDLGAARAILARELSAAQISRISRHTSLQTEVFAHGALCYSVSGQCLMSSFLGGRSANRGECAQPCRLEYNCLGRRGHLLSTKDLCLVNETDALKAAGADCIKIEGRMKNALYVAAVTRAYRKAIDGLPLSREEREALHITYNRGGFTKGLFCGEAERLYTLKPGHAGLLAGKVISVKNGYVKVKTNIELSEGDELTGDMDKTSHKILELQHTPDGYKLKIEDKSRLKAGDNVYVTHSQKLAKNFIYNVNRRLPIKGKAVITQGLPASLTLETQNGPCVEVIGSLPQKADNRPLTEDDIRHQTDKLGGTPFEFEHLKIITDGLSVMPMSALNALRRTAAAELEHKLSSPPPLRINEIRVPKNNKNHTARIISKFAAYVATFGQGAALMGAADIIYAVLPVAKKLKSVFKNSHQNTQIIPSLPIFTTDDDLDVLKTQIKGEPCAAAHTFIDTPGAKIAGYGFNITNSRTPEILSRYGYIRITLSPELSAAQIRGLSVPGNMQTEVIAYGRIPLMTSLNCPIDCNTRECKIKNGGVYMTDRKNMRLPLVKAGDGCRVSLLNPLPIYMADKLSDISADVCALYFTVESPEECANILKTYKHASGGCAPLPNCAFTRGHFYKKKRNKNTGT